MTLTDVFVLVAILLVVGSATAYLIHAKKSGKKCIGCPDSCSCNAKAGAEKKGACGNCGGGCHCHEETK